ncbi:hypothetical protein RO3G_09384 [Lichtheimia corymbifera JMRC:FSU:9682]|uniref:Uncharacterized protein n=1 Tax=Lichtheimia corymbifera JMRC:FSU:9682 TaxID=1263082 RepID=A0A068SF29_9FUNG|nr:hypothetical protein RO3G_09384 [Lichtheimia corymbifera JMRC:FSU:9682]
METRSGIPLGTKPLGNHPVSWNDDEQILVCLPTIVQILVPSLVDITQDEDPYLRIGVRPLKDIPCMQYNDTEVHNPSAQSARLIAEQYRSATWSPTGLSSSGGCILTAVTTKHRVIHYTPSKNERSTSTAPWIPMADMTDNIAQSILGQNTRRFRTIEQVNSFHTLSAKWSPTLALDPIMQPLAILGLASKRGEISLWSYSSTKGFEHQATIHLRDSFATELEWTKWRQHDGKFISHIISSSGTGAATLSSVTVELGSDEESGATTLVSMDATVQETWFQEDHAIIDNISLIQDPAHDNRVKVALFKNTRALIGEIDLDNVPLEPTWKEYWLQDSVTGVAGANWIEDGKRIRIYTSEGQGLVLTVEEGHVVVDAAATAEINTYLVTKIMQQWDEEQASMDQEQIATANNAIPVLYGTSISPIGLYTVYLFGFQEDVDAAYYDSDVNEVWAAFMAHQQQNDKSCTASLLDKLRTQLSNPYFFFTCPFKSILHEPLEYLTQDDEEEENDGIIKWLKTMETMITDGAAQSTQSFKQHLYCDSRATAARALIRTGLELKRYKLIESTQLTLQSLEDMAHMYLTVHFADVCLNYMLTLADDALENAAESDLAVVLLLCDRVLDQPVTFDFAVNTVIKVCTKLSSWPSAQSESIAEEVSRAKEHLEKQEPVPKVPREKCPACPNLLSTVDNKLLICSSNHTWESCSITGKALATLDTQLCVHCGAKSMKSTGCKLADTILSQCMKCIICGSNLSAS